jgi:hypothetical protein
MKKETYNENQAGVMLEKAKVQIESNTTRANTYVKIALAYIELAKLREEKDV